MANEIKKELIQKKLDLVVQKLMHLGAPRKRGHFERRRRGHRIF